MFCRVSKSTLYFAGGRTIFHCLRNDDVMVKVRPRNHPAAFPAIEHDCTRAAICSVHPMS